MDAQQLPTEDLSDLEKRLGRLQPSADGLDAEAMLFAAGRASAHDWRIWAGAAGLIALLAFGLGVALQVERTERKALVQQLAQRQQSLEPPGLDGPPSPVEPGPEGYLRLRDLVVEKGIEAWPAERSERANLEPHLPESQILQVGSWDRLIEQ
jgi:hypothetical protein